jgi:hypothetical protein
LLLRKSHYKIKKLLAPLGSQESSASENFSVAVMANSIARDFRQCNTFESALGGYIEERSFHSASRHFRRSESEKKWRLAPAGMTDLSAAA